MEKEKHIKNILKFLGRADLKGNEVLEFVDCINFLNSEIQKEREKEEATD